MEREMSDVLERNFECPFCAKCFSRHFNLKRHLKSIHNICVKKEGEVVIEFDSFEEFLIWKETEEKATKSNYVKHNGSIVRKYGDLVSIYHCSRGGIYRPKGNGIKSLKSQGSSKIGTTCPARMKVTSSEGKVVLHYFPKHQFHDTQLEHLRLSYSDRAEIAEKLRKGISMRKILQDFNEEVTIGCGRKILTLRDIFNVKRDFNIKDTNPESKEDESSKKISNLIKEPNEHMPIVVTFKDISNISREFVLNNSISNAENSIVKVNEHIVEHPTVVKVTPISTTGKDFNMTNTLSGDESNVDHDEQPEDFTASEKNNYIIKRKIQNILAILDDCTLTAQKRDVICEKLDSIFNLCWADFVKNPAMFLYPD